MMRSEDVPSNSTINDRSDPRIFILFVFLAFCSCALEQIVSALVLLSLLGPFFFGLFKPFSAAYWVIRVAHRGMCEMSVEKKGNLFG